MEKLAASCPNVASWKGDDCAASTGNTMHGIQGHASRTTRLLVHGYVNEYENCKYPARSPHVLILLVTVTVHACMQNRGSWNMYAWLQMCLPATARRHAHCHQSITWNAGRPPSPGWCRCTATYCHTKSEQGCLPTLPNIGFLAAAPSLRQRSPISRQNLCRPAPS